MPREKKTLKREVKNLMGNLSHMARAYNHRTLIILFGNEVYKARSVHLAKFIGGKWLRGRQSSLFYVFLLTILPLDLPAFRATRES